MVYEFEGRTETEAIDRAAEELGLQKDDFDVEILETQRSGLFKKGFVKIRVHTNKPESAFGPAAAKGAASREPPHSASAARTGKAEGKNDKANESGGRYLNQSVFGDPEPKNEFEKQLIEFVEGIIERMGYSGKVMILFREEHKIGLRIDSDYTSILIGKKGKNLDALQLLANIYAGRKGREDMRVVLDSENYRIRREESLVRLAYTVADRVRETRGSILLEPMNPFDRRIIHTTLNDIADVETKSEGEGLYKQIRVYFRGMK
ncbi:MAG: protein jag [Treponema sp.]|jgi:spoIIIJ-associated protein|nr:protein jag [Treponema sp.]